MAPVYRVPTNMSANSTAHEGHDDDDDEDDNRQQREQEVDALRALYGDDLVTVDSSGDGVTCISVDLSALVDNACLGSSVTVSVQLPAAYPSHSLPRTPTLVCDSLTSAHSARLILAATGPVSADVSLGQVCLFQYLEAIIDNLHSFKPPPPLPLSSSSSLTSSTSVPGEQQNQFVTSIVHGVPLTDKKSVFQAHFSYIDDADHIPLFLTAVTETNKKSHDATHIMWACTVTGHHCGDDDGEKGAFKIILHVLQQLDVSNVVVAVSRWFGGVKLGPARFKHIASVTRDIIIQCHQKHEQPQGKVKK